MKVVRFLYRLSGWLAPMYLVLFVAVLLITWEVVMRYLFNAPHSWFEETTVFLCLLGAFLGSGIATLARDQVTIDVLYINLGKKWRGVVDKIIAIVSILTCGFIIYCLLKYASFINGQGAVYPSDLKSPYSIPAYILAVGMLLNMVFSVSYLFSPVEKQEAGRTEDGNPAKGKV